MATFMPPAARSSAHTSPATPAPITIASYRSAIWTIESEISEGFVPLADGLLEPGLGGASLEGEPLGAVPGDAVEDDAELLSRLQSLRVERLVDEQLVHDELVGRYPGDPVEKLLETLVELRRRGRLRRQTPLNRG